MYKTSTFLTSLFSKFRVKDRQIRRQIVELYRPLIESILLDVPESRRVVIFKELLPSIQSVIPYLEVINSENNGDMNTYSYEALKSSINFNYYLIKKIGIRSDGPDTFSSIMKQVNIDDIACDIGVCIQTLKGNMDEDEREGINSELQILLADYNIVMGQDLTIKDILQPAEVLDHEL